MLFFPTAMALWPSGRVRQVTRILAVRTLTEKSLLMKKLSAASLVLPSVWVLRSRPELEDAFCQIDSCSFTMLPALSFSDHQHRLTSDCFSSYKHHTNSNRRSSMSGLGDARWKLAVLTCGCQASCWSRADRRRE